MAKYNYWLVEKTTLRHTVDADSRDDADAIIEDFLNSGEIDWGLGDMETYYAFDGEE